MRIDLHTHSNRSDGTDSPSQIVTLAKNAGLDVVAITDHDSTAGWEEAASAAATAGITLVKGMEVSTKHDGVSVHLLAYEFDPADSALSAELRKSLGSRDDRIDQVLEKLDSLGMNVTREEVLSEAAGAPVGKPHFARALIKKGHIVADEAYADLLEEGGRAHVERYSIALVAAIQLIASAGGVAVLAHPWARTSRSVLDRKALQQMRDAGLAGIEVAHPDHDEETERRLALLVDELGLVATGSSDFHGAGKDLDRFYLGARTTDRDQFDRLFANHPSVLSASQS